MVLGVIILFIFSEWLCSQTIEENVSMNIGEYAVPFCLPDGDGKPFCLKDASGKWVVLYFYPKDDTPGCTLEAIDFTKQLEKFHEQNAIVIGISPDSKESHCRFRDKHNLKVKLLSDADQHVLKEYHVWILKKQYGKIDYGVERTTIIIDPKGVVQFVWLKVKVPGHIEEVLEKLKKIQ